MAYKIVFFEIKSADEALKCITEEVNSLIHEGWKPQGGISIVKDELGFYQFYQAMVQNKKAECQ